MSAKPSDGDNYKHRQRCIIIITKIISKVKKVNILEENERKAYIMCIENEKEARMGFFLFCTIVCCTLILCMCFMVGIIMVNWIMSPSDYESATTTEIVNHSISEIKSDVSKDDIKDEKKGDS